MSYQVTTNNIKKMVEMIFVCPNYAVHNMRNATKLTNVSLCRLIAMGDDIGLENRNDATS